MAENNAEIILYSTPWCGDCFRARFILDSLKVKYRDINIDQDPNGERFVLEHNHGNRSVPTIIFPDGSLLVEPPRHELIDKLTKLLAA